MGGHQVIAKGSGAHADGREVIQARRQAGGLRNLRALHREPRAVHPILDPRSNIERMLGLGDFVAVMHRDVIDTSGVDLELITQVLAGHRAALDMPARKPNAPRARPLELSSGTALRREFPEREVGYVALLTVSADAAVQRARAQPRQLAVMRRAAGVEVHGVARAVA